MALGERKVVADDVAGVAEAGVDATSLPEDKRADAIRVSVRGAGVEPTMVSLIIAFAPAANEVLIALWKRLVGLLPDAEIASVSRPPAYGRSPRSMPAKTACNA